MNNKGFNELLAGDQEMGEISRRASQSSRRFNFEEPEVKDICEKVGLSQTRFAEPNYLTMVKVRKTL